MVNTDKKVYKAQTSFVLRSYRFCSHRGKSGPPHSSKMEKLTLFIDGVAYECEVVTSGGVPFVEPGGEPLVEAGGELPVEAGGEPLVEAGAEPPVEAGGEPSVEGGGEPPVEAGGEPLAEAGGEPLAEADEVPEIIILPPPGVKYSVWCPKCGKQFPTKMSKSWHMKTHQPGGSPRVSCTQCNKTFTREASLKRHEKEQHNNLPRKK